MSIHDQILATLTKEGLLTWLRTQPPETTFNYGTTTDCVAVRYCKAQGFPITSAGGSWVRNDHGLRVMFPQAFEALLLGEANTYGELIQLMEKV